MRPNAQDHGDVINGDKTVHTVGPPASTKLFR
jgi:hypothetical protein